MQETVFYPLLVLFVVSCSANLCVAQSGTQVGPPFGFSAANVVGSPAGIAVSSSGVPFVVWDRFNRSTGLTAIFVSFFDGSQWVTLPQVNTRNRRASASDIEIDSTGMPYVAWIGATGLYRPSQLSVSRFDGSQWIEIGGTINRSVDRSVVFGNLELTEKDEPIVSWDERFGFPLGDESYVMIWDGLDWHMLGDPLPNSIRDLQIGYRKDGQQVLYLALIPTASEAPKEIQIRRWNGTRWRKKVTIPANDPSVPFGLRFRMRLQTNGLPQVYWTEGPSPSLLPWHVRVKGKSLQYFDTSQVMPAQDFAIRGQSVPLFAAQVGRDQITADLFRYGVSTPQFVSGTWHQHRQTPFRGTGNIHLASHNGTVFIVYFDIAFNREQIVVRQF